MPRASICTGLAFRLFVCPSSGKRYDLTRNKNDGAMDALQICSDDDVNNDESCPTLPLSTLDLFTLQSLYLSHVE